MIKIRTIEENNSLDYMALWQTIVNESPYLMREPDEAISDPIEIQNRAQKFLSKDNSTILVAETDNKLVGYLVATGGAFKRNKRSVYLGMGILESHCNQGIGTKLLLKLEDWAKQNQIHRFELTVMTTNTRAIALYKKMGFEIEGTKKDSMFVDGQFVDEYYMGKILNANTQ